MPKKSVSTLHKAEAILLASSLFTSDCVEKLLFPPE